jgi:MtN3 and saliva related transmembrane protein
MDFKTILGLIAGCFTAGCLLPQVIKSYHTKSTGDISLIYLLALTVGALLWTVYGSLINSYAIILANFVSFLLVVYILFIKIKYKDA